MTNDELLDLWEPAADRLFSDTNQFSKLKHLDEALGTRHYSVWCHSNSLQDEPLPKEMTDLLKKILGPHGNTILKAYQIRKGIATNGKVLQTVGESDQTSTPRARHASRGFG